MIGRAELARDLLIVACAISAGIHAALTGDHLAHGAAAGAAFALAAAALAVLAATLTARPGSAPVAAAALLLTGLLGAYAFALAAGVPVLHPEREGVDGLAVFTKAVELVGLGSAAALLRRRDTAASRGRPIPLALTALVAVFGALAALAVHSGHAHHAAPPIVEQR